SRFGRQQLVDRLPGERLCRREDQRFDDGLQLRARVGLRRILRLAQLLPFQPLPPLLPLPPFVLVISHDVPPGLQSDVCRGRGTSVSRGSSSSPSNVGEVSGRGRSIRDLMWMSVAARTRYSPATSRFISCIRWSVSGYCCVMSAIGMS